MHRVGEALYSLDRCFISFVMRCRIDVADKNICHIFFCFWRCLPHRFVLALAENSFEARVAVYVFACKEGGEKLCSVVNSERKH